METYLIVGLGNPGDKYKYTRHNAGYMAVDKLAGSLGVTIGRPGFHALTASAVHDGKKLILMKPLTYMNLSGEAVGEAAAYLGISPGHIIVLSDDIELPVGHLRVRTRGSAGGHNGLRDIIRALSSEDFMRVRMGVGAKPEYMDLKDYVLSRFGDDDKPVMEKVYPAAAEAVLMILSDGPDAAMNSFNGLNLSS